MPIQTQQKTNSLIGQLMINGITVSPLKEIEVAGGNVLHILKKTDQSFKNFGEAYFSFVNHGAIKAWKMHYKMTLNLVVPLGNVKFVFIDNKNNFNEITAGTSNYVRITVEPMIWFGFMGLEKGQSLILNIGNIIHDPNEIKKAALEDFKYNWS
jgi:dTDP-4-dehydrorhamnose 3,5-epimerase